MALRFVATIREMAQRTQFILQGFYPLLCKHGFQFGPQSVIAPRERVQAFKKGLREPPEIDVTPEADAAAKAKKE